MAPPHTTAWSVYEEQLGSLGWGTPLWYPEPESEGGIQIGDVGYLRRGGFKPFFNAIHSRPLTLTTLPSDFIPLKYNTDLLNVERDNYIDPQPITSKTVTLVNVGANAGAGMVSAGGGGGFKICCSKQQGAMLLLRDSGSLHSVDTSTKFVEYIKNHQKSWWEAVKSELSVKENDIILISGVVKTSTWSMASFVERGTDHEINLLSQVGPIAQAGATMQIQNSNSTSFCREGPKDRIEKLNPGTVQNTPDVSTTTLSSVSSFPKDQDIFIHYYKVKYRILGFAKIAASGPDAEVPDDESNDQDTSAPQAAEGEEQEVDVEISEPQQINEPQPIAEAQEAVTPQEIAAPQEVVEVHPEEMEEEQRDETIEVVAPEDVEAPDPLDIVLDYILEHAEEADMAVTSTGDILELCGGYHYWPQDMASFLTTHLPRVELLGEEESTKVAYLSISDMIVRRNARMFANSEVTVIPPPQAAPQPPETPEEAGEGEENEGGEDEGNTDNNNTNESGNDENANTESNENEGEIAMPDVQPEAGPSATPPQPAQPELPVDIPPTRTKEVPESLRGGLLILGRHLKEGTQIEWPHRVFLEDAAEGGAVCSLVVSPDSRLAAAGYEDGFIRVWNMELIAMTHKLSGHNESIWALAFSPDSGKLLSGGADHNAMYWDLFRASTEEGYQPERLCGHEYDVWSVAVSPSGTVAATGSVDNKVKLWDLNTYTNYATMTDATAVIIEIRFSPDGTRLCSAADSTGYIYDVKTGKLHAKLKGHDGVIWTIAWSHDGRRLTTGSEDHTARVWDAENGDELVIIREHTGPVWSVSFSPDDQDIAAGSYDAAVSVCNSLDGNQRHLFKERPSIVNEVAFSPDGDVLAAGCADGAIKLWEMETGDLLTEIQGHKDKVKDITFTPNGHSMVSGSDDGTVRVWNMRDILRVV